MPELSHCGKTVYAHDRDRFYVSLFAGSGREALQAVYALNIELAQIHSKTSEVVIGQMRLAWWQEAIQALYAGQLRHGQPVLEALQPVIQHVSQEMLMPLVERYREAFSELPHVDDMLDAISLQLLYSICPESEPRWRKAHKIITNHRRRYGQCRNGWLNIKLLLGAA